MDQEDGAALFQPVLKTPQGGQPPLAAGAQEPLSGHSPDYNPTPISAGDDFEDQGEIAGGSTLGLYTIGIFRVLCYLTSFICGISVAGIIGVTAMSKYTGKCLLSSTLHTQSVENCDYPCKEEDPVCQTGAFCQQVDGDYKCRYAVCFSEGGGFDDESRCQYVVVISAVSGVWALILSAYNIYKMVKTGKSALRTAWTTFLTAGMSLVLGFLMLVTGALITDGFNKLCSSINKQNDLYQIGSCKEHAKLVLEAQKDGGEIYPDFYDELFVAEVMAWVAMFAWLLNGSVAAIRFYKKNKKAKAASYEEFQ